MCLGPQNGALAVHFCGPTDTVCLGPQNGTLTCQIHLLGYPEFIQKKLYLKKGKNIIDLLTFFLWEYASHAIAGIKIVAFEYKPSF